MEAFYCKFVAGVISVISYIQMTPDTKWGSWAASSFLSCCWHAKTQLPVSGVRLAFDTYLTLAKKWRDFW